MKLYQKFLLNAGFRGEWDNYQFNQRKSVASFDSTSIRTYAMEFGFGYKINEASLAYLNYAKSFRIPNTEEFYLNKYIAWWDNSVQGGLNTNIEEQTSNDFELGVKYNLNKNLLLNATAFLMDVKNEIYFDSTSYVNTNYDSKTRHYGIELDLRGSFCEDRVRPYAGLTLQESFFKGGKYAGKQIPFVAKTKLLCGLTVTPIENLNITGSMRFTGTRYLISDQNNLATKLKPFTLFDIKADYTYKNVMIWGAINNVFGYEYQLYGVTNGAGTTENYYAAPERTFEAGVTVRF